jgi:hypothetical protein
METVSGRWLIRVVCSRRARIRNALDELGTTSVSAVYRSRRSRPLPCVPAKELARVRDRRPRAIWRAVGAVGILALQCRACALDRARLLPIGWPQVAAFYEHGLAYARSVAFLLRSDAAVAVDAPAGRCGLCARRVLIAWLLRGQVATVKPQFVGRWIPGSQPAGFAASE